MEKDILINKQSSRKLKHFVKKEVFTLIYRLHFVNTTQAIQIKPLILNLFYERVNKTTFSIYYV